MNTLSIDVPVAARALAATLAQHGHRAWVVGGCVRDAMLGRTPHDWDLCTTARPDVLMRIFPEAIPTGLQHGTITVVRDGVPYEITTLRGDGTYSDGRRPDEVIFLEDIVGDLARRDFTVNAMAYDPLEGVLEDPHGGRLDLARGRLRCVGEAAQRFAEDGLRVMRAVRFMATLEFTLDAATEVALPQAAEGLACVSVERVRDEWCKLLRAPRPAAALSAMRRGGLLAVVCADAAEASAAVWEEVERVVEALSPDPVLRMAAILHGVGMASEAADAWLERGRWTTIERNRIVHLMRHADVAYVATWTDADVRRWLQRITVAALEDWMALAVARKTYAVSLGERARERTAARDPLTVRELAVTGGALMEALGLRPGPRVGKLLAVLLEHVVENPALNTREQLVALAWNLESSK
jgi:tRNA nucleotidyltransferase (CCA-adding enzyme)